MPMIYANVDHFLYQVDQKEATADCDFCKGLCFYVKAFQILPNLKYNQNIVQSKIPTYRATGQDVAREMEGN